MSKRVALILSGCGVFDGSEIHEAVACIFALDRRGARISYFAPNMPQAHVIDHLTRKPVPGEKRNVLAESARIARGNVAALASLKVADFDAIVFPGGFGAAKNLCDFAFKGVECDVHPQVERVILEAHAAKKPIGFACISPVIAARVLGRKGINVTLTIGSDRATADAISHMGGTHVATEPLGVTIDHENKIVSAACYMLDVSPAVILDGATRLCDAVLELA